MKAILVCNKRRLLLCLLLCSISKLYAQKSEVGGLIGPTYYWGDIVNNLQMRNMQIGGSLFYRYHYSPKIAFRANLSYARIRGADSLSRGSSWQINRNLSFWTDIFEVSGIVEYNLIADNNKSREVKTRSVPYVFGGVGVFHFNPKANNPITGEVNELKPLKLNGQGYSLTAICIPMGVGYRFYVNRRWQVGLEIGMRYSLSSYIDDVDGKSEYPKQETLESDEARIMYSPTVARQKAIRAEGNTYVAGPDGKERGKNEYISDVYFIAGVTVSYRLWPGQSVRCPRIY